MESDTEGELVFDVGSMYECFQSMNDKHKIHGIRYRLETILTLLVLAKLCGEDTPSEIAE